MLQYNDDKDTNLQFRRIKMSNILGATAKQLRYYKLSAEFNQTEEKQNNQKIKNMGFLEAAKIKADEIYYEIKDVLATRIFGRSSILVSNLNHNLTNAANAYDGEIKKLRIDTDAAVKESIQSLKNFGQELRKLEVWFGDYLNSSEGKGFKKVLNEFQLKNVKTIVDIMLGRLETDTDSKEDTVVDEPGLNDSCSSTSSDEDGKDPEPTEEIGTKSSLNNHKFSENDIIDFIYNACDFKTQRGCQDAAKIFMYVVVDRHRNYNETVSFYESAGDLYKKAGEGAKFKANQAKTKEDLLNQEAGKYFELAAKCLELAAEKSIDFRKKLEFYSLSLSQYTSAKSLFDDTAVSEIEKYNNKIIILYGKKIGVLNSAIIRIGESSNYVERAKLSRQVADCYEHMGSIYDRLIRLYSSKIKENDLIIKAENSSQTEKNNSQIEKANLAYELENCKLQAQKCQHLNFQNLDLSATNWILARDQAVNMVDKEKYHNQSIECYEEIMDKTTNIEYKKKINSTVIAKNKEMINLLVSAARTNPKFYKNAAELCLKTGDMCADHVQMKNFYDFAANYYGISGAPELETKTVSYKELMIELNKSGWYNNLNAGQNLLDKLIDFYKQDNFDEESFKGVMGKLFNPKESKEVNDIVSCVGKVRAGETQSVGQDLLEPLLLYYCIKNPESTTLIAKFKAMDKKIPPSIHMLGKFGQFVSTLEKVATMIEEYEKAIQIVKN